MQRSVIELYRTRWTADKSSYSILNWAMQSSLFHDRQRKGTEQELRKLFYKAYIQTVQRTTDLEDISKSVLCNQFVVGLLPDIKIKTEEFWDLAVADKGLIFEEAKLQELGKSEAVPGRKQSLRFNAGGPSLVIPYPTHAVINLALWACCW